MSILIKIKGGKATRAFKLTPQPDGERLLKKTPLLIWEDLLTTQIPEGRVLRRWKARRARETFTGLCGEEGPELADGDEVTFVVAPSTPPVQLSEEKLRKGRDAIARLRDRTNVKTPLDTGPLDDTYREALSADEVG